MSTVATLDDFAHQLLTLATRALASTDAGWDTSRYPTFVSPTLPVLDCCPMLCVDVRGLALEITAPTIPLPALGHRLGGAQATIYLATLVVTAVRCAPTVEENRLPSPPDMAAAAKQTNEDVWALWNAIASQQRSGGLFPACKALYLDQPVPVNAEGGCVGWTLTVRPAIDGYTPALP